MSKKLRCSSGINSGHFLYYLVLFVTNNQQYKGCKQFIWYLLPAIIVGASNSKEIHKHYSREMLSEKLVGDSAAVVISSRKGRIQ